jgi:hypothetical protein
MCAGSCRELWSPQTESLTVRTKQIERAYGNGVAQSGPAFCASGIESVGTGFALLQTLSSEDMGSVVTTFLDTFDGRSNTGYKNLLSTVHPTATSHDCVSFVSKKVAAQTNGVWTTGTIQCLRQGLFQSMTLTLTVNTILPNKSKHFKSLVWADDTDSICDLPSVETLLDNHVSNYHHRGSANRSSPATNGSDRRVSNGTAAPSSLPSSSSPSRSPLPPRDAPQAVPSHTAGIFEVIPSLPGDLVDKLTRSGSFDFLSELFDTDRLFELRDFRIPGVTPKGEDIEQFVSCIHLVLDLDDKYPHDSLVVHILDCVPQFLPALLWPCTHRDRVRQIISSTKRFQRGDWKGLWETALSLPRKEIDTNNKRKHNHVKRDTSSIQARVVYVEHCVWKGACRNLINL